MEFIRAFIAIELPDSIKSSISLLQNDLKRSTSAPVKWVAPNSIHLTLKFLGNISQDKIPEISEVIDKTTRKTAPFSLELSELGAFPNTHSPRVVWIGLKGDIDTLSVLQKNIESTLIPHGFPPEGKGFSPHLTLGRVREKLIPEDRRRLGELVASTEVSSASPFTVDSLNLMRSTLTPSGAVYRCLYSSALPGG
jgi:2'-5' RNA ligase